MRGVFDHQRADADRREQQMQVRMDAKFARQDAEMLRREQEAAEKACLRMELAQLKKDIAVAEKRQTAVQLLLPPPAAAQPDMHADSLISASISALQSASDDAAAADCRQRELCYRCCKRDCSRA